MVSLLLDVFAKVRCSHGHVGIFTTSDGQFTTIVNSSNVTGSVFHPTINNSGTVAFFEDDPKANVYGIFTGNGGPITTIADSSGLFKRFLDGFAINSSGTVAFNASPNEVKFGIFTSNGGPISTIIDSASSSSPADLFALPVINDNNTVAFLGEGVFLTTGNRTDFGIFTSNGGPLTTVADSSGPFSYVFAPSINNSGTVTFIAGLQDGSTGIFTGPNPSTDKVIKEGDSLFGSTVTRIQLENPSNNRVLNNSGQLVFEASLADGTSGIFCADPVTVTVPEPSSTIGVLGFGVLGVGHLLRRKPNKQKSINLG